MFSSKPSANMLAGMMQAHGVLQVVVCPGSRNAPLVHNFSELAKRGGMRIYPVTDERSAAFVAIGLYLATHQPAAVCVTSGTALLNTLPAVAEAYYRHIPLLVVSADRPPQDIGQLKGQTLLQQGALQPYSPTWQLPEGDCHQAEALAAEALASLYVGGGRPVHINVPLSEPLHIYDAPALPVYPSIRHNQPANPNPIPSEVLELIANAELPAVFVGHTDFPPEALLREIDEKRSSLVLSEAIGSSVVSTMHGYHWKLHAPACYAPDVIVHIGGAGIDKDYSWLVRNPKAVVIRIEQDDEAVPDTFGRLHALVRCQPVDALSQLLALPPKPSVERFHKDLADACLSDGALPVSEATKAASVGFTKWERHISRLLDAVRQQDALLHVGNSSVLRYFRLGRMLPPHLFCNRGVNGIEGTLSVAAGHSLATDKLVCCILGDLSFFYDSNALWNGNLRGNLRILLLNDQGGGIFSHVRGLADCPSLPIVSACHHATAEGICRSYGADYIALQGLCRKDSSKPLQTLPDEALSLLTAPPDSRCKPLVVECFT